MLPFLKIPIINMKQYKNKNACMHMVDVKIEKPLVKVAFLFLDVSNYLFVTSPEELSETVTSVGFPE